MIIRLLKHEGRTLTLDFIVKVMSQPGIKRLHPRSRQILREKLCMQLCFSELGPISDLPEEVADALLLKDDGARSGVFTVHLIH